MDFVFLGFMAAMAVAGLAVGKLAGKKLGKAEFDERQQLARGKAYKAGFYTLLVGLLAVYLIPIFTEWQPKDTALLPFAVFCVGVTVLHYGARRETQRRSRAVPDLRPEALIPSQLLVDGVDDDVHEVGHVDVDESDDVTE